VVRSSVRGFRNVRDGVRQFGIRGVFKERDAFAFEGGEGAVNLFVGMFFRGEGVVHLVVKKIALFFAQFDEQPDLILLFLNFPWQWFLPSSAASLPGPLSAHFHPAGTLGRGLAQIESFCGLQLWLPALRSVDGTPVSRCSWVLRHLQL